MSRDLVFRWKPAQLTKDVNLAFAFEDGSTSIPAWKVIKMSAYPEGSNVSYTTIQYTGRYAFGCTIGNGGDRGPVTTYAPMKPGDRTQLITSTCGNPLFTTPIPRPDVAEYEASNATGEDQIISFGLLSNEPETYHPIANFPIPKDNSVDIDAPTTLRAFPVLPGPPTAATSGTTANGAPGSEDTINGGAKEIWSAELKKLPARSTWDFKETAPGVYELVLVSNSA